MPNIHGLFSGSGRSTPPDNGTNEEDNRFVGGIGAQGGGSGLAVQPNPSNATDPTSSIFSRAEQGTEAPSSNSRRRTITMYQSGFVVDDGPYRRLDDPTNREFLTALAQGRVPRELMNDDDVNADPNAQVEVGLIDKRKEEYAVSETAFSSFTGVGESLGSVTSSANTSGIITPPSDTQAMPPPGAGDVTSVQIRLLAGKRLVIKILKSATVQELGDRVNASGMAGSDPYVLVTGFPPKPITDLSLTVGNAGLAGASVQQKKA